MSSGRAPRTGTDLEALIPIAVVIGGGCVPCARRMVARALDAGASERQVRKTLALVGVMQRQDCFADSVGPQVIDRMRAPLAAGYETLEARCGRRSDRAAPARSEPAA